MPSSVPTTTQILTPSAFSSPSSLSSAPYSIFSLLLSLNNLETPNQSQL